jgi:hypothetical protein
MPQKAVQNAVELKPDLILMNVGLPPLSVIEAARRIRLIIPESKIILLRQESTIGHHARSCMAEFTSESGTPMAEYLTLVGRKTHWLYFSALSPQRTLAATANVRTQLSNRFRSLDQEPANCLSPSMRRSADVKAYVHLFLSVNQFPFSQAASVAHPSIRTL